MKPAYLSLLFLLFISIERISAQENYSEKRYGIDLQEVWIEMPDGIRLAVDLYLPTGATPGEKFPVLLEYLPYRKDEGRRNRYALFSYFVQRGYAVARVDIRGTGKSEGLLVAHEYTEQEQLDGEVVIEWLAKAPFSTGSVGMFGISWGGFNALHMAMRKPPALKTIVTLMSTDDIYQDDVHFIDGMMHIDAYEIGRDLTNAMPGAPEFIIDENYYQNRFDTEPWLLIYKQQQRDGAFWDRASLNRDYSLIDIPVYAIGGLFDGYRDFIPRLLQHGISPVKALMGPWNHIWPNWADPGPAIEWRYDAVRWFDYWLKNEDNGIMNEPRFTFYQRRWHEPGMDLKNIPGEWRQDEGWPLANSSQLLLNLQADRSLSASVPESFSHHLKYKPTVGVEASGSVMWWGDWAPDQRAADIYSLVYDSEPISEELEIAGFPLVSLNVSADAPLAHWLVRLSDVAPDGTVTQITGAGFNGAHRNSAENPESLEPGTVYPLDIELHFTTWTFPKGHRIRVAINNAQWPMIWPTPYVMTTSVHGGREHLSQIKLPMPPKGKPSTFGFQEPETDPELPGYKTLFSETISGYAEIAEIHRNEREKTSTVIATNSGASEFPWGKSSYTEKIVHHADDKQPSNTSVESIYTRTVETGDRILTWEGVLEFSSDELFFYYAYTRKLFEGEKTLREKTWEKKIPRDFQ